MIKDKSKTWEVTSNRFVCFLDIMGFKDKVMRESHEKIYSQLLSLKQHIGYLEDSNDIYIFDAKANESIHISIFSDSIIIFSESDTIAHFHLFIEVSNWLFAKAMELLLPMKGAIAYGAITVDIDNHIFFGQPIIDAYLLQEEVFYYGVVLHHTVEKFLDEAKVTSTMIFNIKTPMKASGISHSNLKWYWALYPKMTKRETAYPL